MSSRSGQVTDEGPVVPSPYGVPSFDPARHVHEALTRTFGDRGEVCVVRAPGRVNLIGDHTDYNDGFVLPMTIDRAVYVALRRREDRSVQLLSLNYGERLSYRLDARPDVAASSWASYVTGVVEELRVRDVVSSGFDAVLYGDVPLGAGLSSSAALEVAVVVGVPTLFGRALEPVAAARLCQYVEHTYAGVRCGIMDQFASRLGRQAHALFLDCRTLDFDHVPLALDDHVFVVIDSKASRGLVGSRYNERRAECEAGVAAFQRIDPSITALRDVSVDFMDRHESVLPDPVRRRCRHVVTENQRVLDARAALSAGALSRFGALMTQSHVSLRDLYEVSSPQLDLLVDTALLVDGVLGARLTGAGFGGCTVNLVHRAAVPLLKARIVGVYRAAFGLVPDVYVLDQNAEAGAVAPVAGDGRSD